MVGSDFGSTGSAMMTGAYASYDTRPTNHYGTHSRPHHESSVMEPAISAEEMKSITEHKDYQYYPNPILSSSQDPRGPVEMFQIHRSDQGSPAPSMGSALDVPSRVKQECDRPEPVLPRNRLPVGQVQPLRGQVELDRLLSDHPTTGIGEHLSARRPPRHT